MALVRHISLSKTLQNFFFLVKGLQGDGREPDPSHRRRLPQPPGAEAEGLRQAQRKLRLFLRALYV